MQTTNSDLLRHDWAKEEILALFDLPLTDLLFQAQSIHREHFEANAVQKSRNFSIKTGLCPEDCTYCSQSGHNKTGLEKQSLLSVETVIEEAKKAKENGADRFCMGAAWRSPPAKDMPKVIEMVKAVKDLGLESCVTLGMLSENQANELADAGVDYYNHNLDTSPEHYPKITTTRTYDDRLKTLEHVRNSGMKVCCGGILGLGETRSDRAGLLQQLANLPKHPESVPINTLIKIKGTPLENAEDVSAIEWVRTVAVARVMMPKSFVRLSAGRNSLSTEAQALAFMGGANSVFVGDTLLTAANPSYNSDAELFSELGLKELKVCKTNKCEATA